MIDKEPYNYNDEALKQIEDGCMSSIILGSFIIFIIISILLYIKTKI